MAGYNQYIGMRYVPIVDGEWSQSKAYEPLVVVVYNGNSYISKTYTPAGTLPTNDTYWMLAANYNAQVEQYRTEVRQYQETVEGFDGDIQAASDKADAAAEDVDALELRTETLETFKADWDTVDTWEQLTSLGYVYVRRVGHVVTITCNGGVAFTAAQGQTLSVCNIPERFRPVHRHGVFAVDNAAGTVASAVDSVSVFPTGDVNMYFYTAGTKDMRFDFTYIR